MSFCDDYPWICNVIDTVGREIGSPIEPGPDGLANNPRLKEVEERLSSEQEAPLSRKALLVAQGLRQINEHEKAVRISEAIPQIVASSETTSAIVLGQAMTIKARSQDALGQSAEADATFALAEHIYTLAGRTQRSNTAR